MITHTIYRQKRHKLQPSIGKSKGIKKQIANNNHVNIAAGFVLNVLNDLLSFIGRDRM